MAWTDAARAASAAVRRAHGTARKTANAAQGKFSTSPSSRYLLAKKIRAMRSGVTPLNQRVLQEAAHSTRAMHAYGVRALRSSQLRGMFVPRSWKV